MSSRTVRMDLFKDEWMNDPWGMDRFAEMVPGLKQLDEKLKQTFIKYAKTDAGMSLEIDSDQTFDFGSVLPRGAPRVVRAAIAFAEDLQVALAVGDKERQVRVMPALETPVDPTPRPGDVITIGEEDSDIEMLEEEIVIEDDEEELAFQLKGEPLSQPVSQAAERTSSASSSASKSTTVAKSSKAKEKTRSEVQNEASERLMQQFFAVPAPRPVKTTPKAKPTAASGPSVNKP